jgi:hypothetical protein
MLDDPTRLQLARLATTGSRGYSPPNPRNVAALTMQETNGMSNGAATLIAGNRVGDRA